MITTTVRRCVERVFPKTDPVRKRELWENETLNQQMRDLQKCNDNSEKKKLRRSIKGGRRKFKKD